MEPPRPRYCAPSSPPGRGRRENKGLRRKGPPGTGSAGGPEEAADSRKPKFVSTSRSRGGGARGVEPGRAVTAPSPLRSQSVPGPPGTGGPSREYVAPSGSAGLRRLIPPGPARLLLARVKGCSKLSGLSRKLHHKALLSCLLRDSCGCKGSKTGFWLLNGVTSNTTAVGFF